MADEINRTPPKTQAALLEAMEERQVTIDGTHAPAAAALLRGRHAEPAGAGGHLPAARGAAGPLPDARPRGLPGRGGRGGDAARLPPREGDAAKVERVLTRRRRSTALQRHGRRGALRRRPSSQYVVHAGPARRAQNPRVRLGASPRSAQALLAAAKARAALRGTDFVTPDDVKAVCPSVLNHRLILKAEAEVEGITADEVIRQTLERVQVPGDRRGPPPVPAPRAGRGALRARRSFPRCSRWRSPVLLLGGARAGRRGAALVCASTSSSRRARPTLRVTRVVEAVLLLRRVQPGDAGALTRERAARASASCATRSRPAVEVHGHRRRLLGWTPRRRRTRARLHGHAHPPAAICSFGDVHCGCRVRSACARGRCASRWRRR